MGRTADAPDLSDIGVAQRPIAFERIAEIHHATGDIQQTFGCVVGGLSQCLGVRDTHPDGNAVRLRRGWNAYAAQTQTDRRGRQEIRSGFYLYPSAWSDGSHCFECRFGEPKTLH